MQVPARNQPRTPTLHNAKRALRARILAARNAMPVEMRIEADGRIASYVEQLPGFRHATTVLITLNFGSEASTTLIGELALRQGKTLLAPRVNPTTKMLDLYQIRDLAGDLGSGVWGIPEPKPELCAKALPAVVDWVLVPGIAFDKYGGRLGYGGGYYDRLLPLLRPLTPNAAIAYSLQVVDCVPHGRHDLRVETLITEEGPVAMEAPAAVPESSSSLQQDA